MTYITMMLSVVENSDLTQLVTFPTRGGSILDLVLSSHSDLVSNIHSSEGISDHSTVSFDVNLAIKLNKKKPRSVYKFSNTDFNEVRMDATELSKAFFARNSLDYSVEDNWQFFKTGLLEVVRKRVPTKKLVTWSDSPWMTSNLKRQMVQMISRLDLSRILLLKLLK